MDLSLRQIRAFATLAQCNSFAEASEQLHITQPALSTAIKNMEIQAGGKLFNRSTRRIELTAEGRDFLPVARRLIDAYDAALDDLGRAFRLQQGRIQVAVMPSFAMNALPGALKHFRDAHPGINVSVLDIVMEDTLQAVRDGDADLGITFEPEQLMGLEFIPLFSDRFTAVVPAHSPLAEQSSLAWQALCELPFIAMNRGSWTRTRTERAMQDAGVSPVQLLEATQLATIGRMVATGLGGSVVPSLCSAQMTELGARCVPLAQPLIEARVGIFVSPRHPPSTAAAALIEVLLATFGSATGP
ncbi:MAG: LysR family transcriptional regulator [Pseudomonadota bacterium]